MRRTGVLAVCWLAVASVVAACGAGPSIRPDVAVVQDVGGEQPAEPEQRDPGTAQLPVPQNDLAWRDCTAETIDGFALPPGPAGLVLECAQVPAPIDVTGTVPGTFPLGVLRARLSETPGDVAPLVVTTGSDLPSSRALAALATGPMSATLTARPLVAVDRRGLGMSQEIDCIFGADRRALSDLGQFGRSGEASDRVAELGRQATISCTDYLQPQQLMFGASHAASDIEQLRRAWDVDRLGLLGIGNGATVALAYAAAYPGGVGRLLLDSPAAATADAELLAESAARGAEAAVDDFARRCAALECSLGPDPRGAIEDLYGRAADGLLAPVSSNALLTALTAFLGTPRADLQARIRELSDILAAARDGDVMPLLESVGTAEAMLTTDGQWVSQCSDGQRWPTAMRAAELQKSWSTTYPLFGSDAAVAATSCAAWPSMAPPPLPAALDVPVLVTSAAADPIVGNAGLDSVTGALTASGIRWTALAWQGAGYSATLHSACAQSRAEAYVANGELPPNGSLCPA
ncbi:alpha/beta hydrolase [Rhodococcus sp. F64268]|uniref:alpha/beta hydrolase n=1 Tax=unclassified Rhodococcus (in: high G+C Gram-positive bacteria) TaxID=192944 RepID=UPI001980000E|nr:MULTISPECIES: alpha/beta hydrolase [unclassified Rhodococcus (in: high G+C Gram-positive bacteria)]MCK0092234.1 alpha/beta hydrolase [Rhodococcus sp. F64268]